MNTPPLLETRNLTVGIGQRIFCQGLNLRLHAGERLAILGQNGTGKSTLLSVLAGLRAPQSGEVLLKGSAYAALGPRKSALIRGWLPQARQDPFASTVLETALVGRYPHIDRWGWETERDANIARNALAAVDLPNLEDREIQTLSGGERQRLAIATLLTQDPALFLLDEPMTYLDLKHQIAILTLLAELVEKDAKSVVMVLHEPALAARFCDQALLIHSDGHAECGPIAEMLTAERLSQLFQHPLKAISCDGYVHFVPA